MLEFKAKLKTSGEKSIFKKDGSLDVEKIKSLCLNKVHEFYREKFFSKIRNIFEYLKKS